MIFEVYYYELLSSVEFCLTDPLVSSGIHSKICRLKNSGFQVDLRLQPTLFEDCPTHMFRRKAYYYNVKQYMTQPTPGTHTYIENSSCRTVFFTHSSINSQIKLNRCNHIEYTFIKLLPHTSFCHDLISISSTVNLCKSISNNSSAQLKLTISSNKSNCSKNNLTVLHLIGCNKPPT